MATKTSILWPPDAESRLIGKGPDAGKDLRQKEKGMVEDKKVGRHHQLKEHEFEPTPGASEEQRAWRAAVHGVAKTGTGLSD